MKKVLKYVFYSFLALFCLAFILRIIVSRSSNVLDSVTPTENAKSAFAEGAVFETHAPAQEISSDGFMRAYSIVAIPDKGELQLTVKYNVSVYKKLSLPEDEQFSYKLYLFDKAEDGSFLNDEEILPVANEFERKGPYGYCRLVFENVDIGERDVELVMLSPDGETGYSAYKIHENGQPFKTYKLSGGEKSLLSGEKTK